MGVQRKKNGFLMNDEDEKYRVAVHEMGHAFMAMYRKPFQKYQLSGDPARLKYLIAFA